MSNSSFTFMIFTFTL